MVALEFTLVVFEATLLGLDRWLVEVDCLMIFISCVWLRLDSEFERSGELDWLREGKTKFIDVYWVEITCLRRVHNKKDRK